MTELPEIKDISHINKNGYYMIGDAVVIANSIGMAEFTNCILPPVKIIKNNVCVQLFISENNIMYCRPITESKDGDVYHNWINLTDLHSS